MYELKINDERGQTQKWWMNFLWELSGPTINDNLEAEFAKWGAHLVPKESEFFPNPMYDSIMFQHEKDLTMFLLRWS